jgi:hypothetical protein
MGRDFAGPVWALSRISLMPDVIHCDFGVVLLGHDMPQFTGKCHLEELHFEELH